MKAITSALDRANLPCHQWRLVVRAAMVAVATMHAVGKTVGSHARAVSVSPASKENLEYAKAAVAAVAVRSIISSISPVDQPIQRGGARTLRSADGSDGGSSFQRASASMRKIFSLCAMACASRRAILASEADGWLEVTVSSES